MSQTAQAAGRELDAKFFQPLLGAGR